MLKLWNKLSPAVRVEAKRDAVVFVGALVATGLFAGPLDKATVVAALVTAVKVTARSVFPHVSEGV